MQKTYSIAIIAFIAGIVALGIYQQLFKSAPVMQHTMEMSMEDMSKNMEGKTGADLEKTFLEDMIVHHQGAVQMAEMLKADTRRPELLNMADAIITAQTQEIETMKKWRSEWFSQDQ